MGIACFQLSILALTARQSKVNKQMLNIQDQRQAVSSMLAMKYQTKINSENKDDWSVDNDIILLKLEDNNLDMEQGLLETELQDLEARIKSFKEQKEKNVKDVPKLSV